MSMERALDILALATVVFWLAIPLFWIPVHLATGFFRRIGLLTYMMPLLTWLPLAFAVFHFREPVLGVRFDMPLVVTLAGVLLFVFGTLLHLWTGRLLSLRGIVGVPEVTAGEKGRLVTSRAFSVVRHPTYLAHTMIFLGVFFMTGVAAVGCVTLLDFVVVQVVIIPLEERELVRRFGKEYEEYRRRVPKYFPDLRIP
jgi:protein-S-isoprenylcysteine O-methyltransferase Ste14